MSGKLSDRVTEQIKKDIASGVYLEGQKIPAEPELMKQYAVGRSTIREAIKSLAISGVLKVQQGSGTFVATADTTESIDQKLIRADFEEVNSVRRLLENELVRLAAIHHNESQLAEVSRHLDARKLAIHSAAQQDCIDADIAFHSAIAQAAANSALAELYISFTSIIRKFFSEREQSGIQHFAMSHHLHEQLFRAIKSRKPKQAQQVLQQILDNNY
ncbi:FadR/GntR family transcriptional regulator [Pedobacter sp. MC2016-24]|uniref:FadR/GntR family transcriptional regulator n=1 Tax=Pedobacter sp. MC2016-24 TaxID=2780090 RepID=UPI00187F30D2|nr:GntR family transcriptional regulator [Pedobacter sp. MC2016-24]MBE9602394.1 FadR family transcriptional regulator [Pedobacter sp. MC2016-24]